MGTAACCSVGRKPDLEAWYPDRNRSLMMHNCVRRSDKTASFGHSIAPSSLICGLESGGAVTGPPSPDSKRGTLIDES